MDPQSKLSPISTPPQKLSDRVFTSLCDAIIAGQLAPGERLREAEIAQALGVSRTPVREALSELEQRHLVQRDVGGGCFVARWDKAILWEVATLRAALERLGIRLAMENLTSQDYDTLERLALQMEGAVQTGDDDALIALDIRFHSHLWSRTGHTLLMETMERMAPQVRYFMVLTRPGDQGAYPDTHRQLIDTLKSGDLQRATQAVEAHVLSTAKRAIARLDETSEPARH